MYDGDDDNLNGLGALGQGFRTDEDGDLAEEGEEQGDSADEYEEE